ncbi:hypothetical protein RUND412_009172 [Rhizina undulata]
MTIRSRGGSRGRGVAGGDGKGEEEVGANGGEEEEKRREEEDKAEMEKRQAEEDERKRIAIDKQIAERGPALERTDEWMRQTEEKFQRELAAAVWDDKVDEEEDQDE